MQKKIDVIDLIEGCDGLWAQMRQQGVVGKLGYRSSGLLT